MTRFSLNYGVWIKTLNTKMCGLFGSIRTVFRLVPNNVISTVNFLL